MNTIKKLLILYLPPWLLATLSGIFILRVPSLFEPFYYGDEMIYLTLGNAIRKGLVLYRDIHDNKTPLIYYLAAVSGNIFWMRTILCFWMIITTILFWKLSQLLFPTKKNISKAATVIFAVITTLPFLEGQIANSEVFLIGFVIISFYLLIQDTHKKYSPLLAGVFLSIATLFKVPAIFEAGSAVFFILIQTKFSRQGIKENTLRLVLFAVGLLVPILLSLVWFAFRGALGEYITAAFLQNIGYVSSTRLGSIQNTTPILTKLTPILIRGGVVAIGFLLLTVFRKRLGKHFIISSAWLLTSLFAATLSERPYPHYLMQAAPAFSLLVAMLLSLNIKEQALTIIPLTLAFFVPVYFKFWYYSPVPYFQNFKTLITEGREAYLKSYSEEVPTTYETAAEIQKTVSADDRVFIWGDAPPIYALSRSIPAIKYVANYHIYDYSNISETVSTLKSKKPKLIVILKKTDVDPYLYSLLKSDYRMLHETEAAYFWYNISQ